MAADGPGFFGALARAFYDFGFYRDVAEDGPRSAVKYLIKLSLLAGALAIAILLAFQRHYFATVIQPKINDVVKPAFEGSPALSWKEGKLTADGTIPFRTSVTVQFEDSLEPLHLTMLIDTRDEPDTASVLAEAGQVHALTASRRYIGLDGEVKTDREYDKSFELLSYPKDEAYRFILPPPKLDPVTVILFALMRSIELLLILTATSILMTGVAWAGLPGCRQLGFGGVWSVVGHALTPGVALLVIMSGVLLFSHRLLPGVGGFPWVLWVAPLLVGLVVAYLALRSVGSDGPRERPKPPKPPKPKDKVTEDDLLSPDKV